ncbi:rhomboid family intramembrane serine protease [Halobiforma nitratireducens]|uniref:Rhomboid family protein n=1 Tax=Halobiforma nitratireducens JCM 10879 TaxID=1227454 RepID=M0LCS5_9EURY|nr:rhomboid family intramembrane serine protease [Halobiforma nitratireducens]EMA30913.1 Rhomboid family protein [Halobiforma nitratireducens JCM 10879]
MLSPGTLSGALAAGVAITLVASIVVVRRLSEPERRWREIAGERLVLGVPWGTLVVIAFVLCVYLFVQDGISDFSDPVTIPYRSWSYFYPLGMLTGSFSHASSGHLISNLAGTVVAAPLAEYAWGHYPHDGNDDSRGSGLRTRLRTDPWLRALVVFPAVVIGIGLLTSLFSLGPVIGFSGVVFAFVAFAIVHYPIVTLVATIGVQGVLTTVYSALRTPIHVYVAEPSPPTAPSWAGIAIQGHALGFVIGLVLGIALLERRGKRPDPLAVWVAILVYAISRGLHQIYWFGEGNSFYLFQGPGVAIVAVLALVITVALTGSDRPVVPRRLSRRLARLRNGSEPVDRPLEIATRAIDRWSGSDAEAGPSASDRTPQGRVDRIAALAGRYRNDRSTRVSGVRRRGAAFVGVLLVLAVLAGMAIPVNVLALDGTAHSPESAIEIEDYTIEYAEDVENELVSDFGIEDLSDGLEASGVIVASEDRNIWMEAVTAQHLGFVGTETVTVGGPGWRETVHVERAGWEPVGNDPVYQVRMGESSDPEDVVFESDASQANVRVDDRIVTVVSEGGEFGLEVRENESDVVERAPIPGPDETTDAASLEFEREDDAVYAVSDGTVVTVATEETYN